MAEANERINQFQDYQTKLTELLSMNPFIKEFEEQAKTIEHLRQRIDQLESSNINQSNSYSYSNYRSNINNPFDSTDNNDLKDEIKSLRERVFELETDLLIQKKDKFTKPTIEEISEKELQSNEPISSDMSISTKSSPLTPTSPTSPTLNPYTERRFETLPERLKPGFHNNSQYIPNQIPKHSRSSETHSSQTQPIQINFSNTPVSPKRNQYFTSNNSSVSSQSGNNYLSDDDSEDNKYVGEQNITEHSSNIDQNREEFVNSHDDLCKCNKCVAAQMREIEFYRSKMRANR
ncbi:19328_t:CDS:2 [Gigaspora margarita]|uniref:19328_t:CDS:1 n=1 Tax=Gigaspora margarita TaxID=4874 RepID=A0ABN7VV36_GIGMA|nr:19328_t:CDS:2 [Gigaspora margarita]